jgi:hypothetical protein
MRKINNFIFCILGCSLSGIIRTYAPVNFNKPFDITFRTERWLDNQGKQYPINFGTQLELGDTSKARNFDSDSVNVLERYQNKQSSIAMLYGADSGSPIDNLLNTVAAATDDGVRGNFKLTGEYEEIAYTFFAQYNFAFDSIPGKFDVSAYLPFRDMEISNVTWSDQTLQISGADLDVREFLTNDIVSLASSLGGLDLNSWSAHGIGDVTFMFRWHEDFNQFRRNITNVRITGKIGALLPTGLEKDENKSLSLPLGSDGAFGIPVSAAIDLFFKHTLRWGLEVEYLKLFDKTKLRRLKTDSRQTDFLFLNKGLARKRNGSTWKFNLYLGSYHFLSGLSATVNYQYMMHNDDKLFAHSNSFSNAIINSAENLKEHSFHNFVFQLNYDFFENYKEFIIKPQLMFFYKIPFAGRREILSDTFGLEFVLNF